MCRPLSLDPPRPSRSVVLSVHILPLTAWRDCWRRLPTFSSDSRDCRHGSVSMGVRADKGGSVRPRVVGRARGRASLCGQASVVRRLCCTGVRHLYSCCTGRCPRRANGRLGGHDIRTNGAAVTVMQEGPSPPALHPAWRLVTRPAKERVGTGARSTCETLLDGRLSRAAEPDLCQVRSASQVPIKPGALLRSRGPNA